MNFSVFPLPCINASNREPEVTEEVVACGYPKPRLDIQAEGIFYSLIPPPAPGPSVFVGHLASVKNNIIELGM